MVEITVQGLTPNGAPNHRKIALRNDIHIAVDNPAQHVTTRLERSENLRSRIVPQHLTALKRDQSFCFTCSPTVPCFNACCRDLNQILTPYDILCLKHHLAMTSTEFLSTYTETNIGPGSGLPVVSLRFGDADDLACPFVTSKGCRVYPARPASCRTYPLARGVARNRETGTVTEHWALIQESHCRGFAEGTSQTVDQWVQDQQIAEHNRMNDLMLELIYTKNRFRPGPLKPDEQRLVYAALYDLDAVCFDPATGPGIPNIRGHGRSHDRTLTDDAEHLVRAMAHLRDIVFSAGT